MAKRDTVGCVFIYFYDRAEMLLYEADMTVVPAMGDEIRFPSGRTMQVSSEVAPLWVIGEREHSVRLVMDAC